MEKNIKTTPIEDKFYRKREMFFKIKILNQLFKSFSLTACLQFSFSLRLANGHDM